MKNFILNNPIAEIWKDANNPLEYLIAFWITGLAILAVTGWLVLVTNFILNPSMFDNVTWGLIDTLGS